MKRFKVLALSGLALSVMLFVVGCATQGTGSSPSTNITNHISNTTTNKLQNVSSNAGSNATSSQLSESDLFSMISQKTGWDFSANSILHSDNGGTAWKNVTPSQALNNQSTFTGGTSIDAKHAWVVSTNTHGSSVFRTSNGGQSWLSTKLPRGYVMTWLSFINSSTGWLLASRGVAAGMEPADLFYTKNGGETWTKIDSSTKGNLPLSGKTGISFTNTKLGWMTAVDEIHVGRVDLYETHDGGRTWASKFLKIPTKVDNHHYAHPTAPVFSSATNGVLPVYFDGGTQSLLYFTKDGGKSWVASKPLPLKKISHLSVSSRQTVWATDGSSLYVTTDGGTKWTNLTHRIPEKSYIIGMYPLKNGTTSIVFTLLNGKVTKQQINI